MRLGPLRSPRPHPPTQTEKDPRQTLPPPYGESSRASMDRRSFFSVFPTPLYKHFENMYGILSANKAYLSYTLENARFAYVAQAPRESSEADRSGLPRDRRQLIVMPESMEI